jgi:predicted GNAT superfamily acetyltransferase
VCRFSTASPLEIGPLGGDRLLIQIPARFQAIRAADIALARAWRAHSRALFEAAFAAGYSVIDLLFEQGRSCYLLREGGEREDRTH